MYTSSHTFTNLLWLQCYFIPKMSNVENLPVDQSISEVTVGDNGSSYLNKQVKVEITDPEEVATGVAMPSADENADNTSGAQSVLIDKSAIKIEKSVDGTETTEEDKDDVAKVDTDESPDQVSFNHPVKAKLRSLVQSGKHFLQCTELASEEEFQRQLSIFKEVAEVQLNAFNKELLRSCPVIITDGTDGMVFKVGELRTCPVELCYTEKYTTHAGVNPEDKKFSFGYRKFGYGLLTRELFNPVIKKCYETVLKYVHKSGRPFHVLRKKPPGFWSSITIMCNKKKELLLQMEVHVSANQFKRQSSELEKMKFLSFFTDGPGKDCNVISLQWKEYLSQIGIVNHVLYGKEFLIERYGDLNLRLYPDDYLFSKPSGIDLLCKVLRELLELQECDPKVTILEIGTGTGIVGMHLSKVCKRVHMLDRMDKAFIEHAEENVKLNGIPNCFVHHDAVVQSIQNVTSTFGEDDKAYAVIHNNMDTRRVVAEMEEIAKNEKIKKAVYLSFDHKIRGAKQIKALCQQTSNTFVPVKIVPLVIVPNSNDIDVAVLLLRQSLLEGNTVENDLSQYEDDTCTVDVADKSRDSENEGEDGGNVDNDEQEPPNKKKKLWKQQQVGGKKLKPKTKKGKRLRQDTWQEGDRWEDDDEEEEELQDSEDTQEMNIRKVGFPSYRQQSGYGGNKNSKVFKKFYQQNEKWPKWQEHPRSWGQSRNMGRGFAGRGFGDRGFGDRGFGDRGFEDRGFGDRGYGDQGFGDRGFRDRGFRDRGFGDRGFGDRGFGDRGFGDRGFRDREFGDRGFGDRGFRDREFGDRGFRDRGYGDRGFEDRGYLDQEYVDEEYVEHGYMDRGYQQTQQDYDNWYPPFNKYQEMNVDNADTSNYQQDNWRGYQQYNNSQQQFFNSGEYQPFNNSSQHQQYSNSQNQQNISSQNQQNISPQNQQNTSSQSKQNTNSQIQQNTTSLIQQNTTSQNQQNTSSQNVQNTTQNQQNTSSQNQQNTSSQNQQYNIAQNQLFNSAQNQLYSGTQNQMYASAQNQLYSSTQNQLYSSAQNQLYSTQNQQYNSAQNQQYNAAQTQQYSNAQTQQYMSQNQQYNYQAQQYNNSQQQFNTQMQMAYGASLKSSGQQMNYDAQGKLTASQVTYDAAVKSGDSQVNYNASEKSDGSNKRFQSYGVDYSNVQQAQNYGTSNWAGQQGTAAYNYGYVDSSLLASYNMSNTSNTSGTSGAEQQSLWAHFVPQSKSTSDTNTN